MKRVNKIKAALLVCSMAMTAMSSLETHAVSINYNSPFSVFRAAQGTQWYTIKGSDGNNYTIPYVMQFNKVGNAVNRYNHYINGTNQFFREPYGDMITYQPVPSALMSKNKTSYSWITLYESKSRTGNGEKKYLNNFWRYNSVYFNTVYCGQREINNPIPFQCVGGNKWAGNPSGVKGHVYQTSGIRSDGTYGGISYFGEARYVGYSSVGDVIDNTYFPVDSPLNYSAATYPYKDRIFANGTVRTVWDKPANTKEYALKKAALEKLIKQENLPTDTCKIGCWMERLSLLNNPVTEAAVFKGIRGDGQAGYQALVLKPEASATMNLGITKIELIQKEDGKEHVLQRMTRPPRSGVQQLSANYYPKLMEGETYQLVVEVTNDSDRTMYNDTCFIELNGKEYQTAGKVAAGGKCRFEIDYKVLGGKTQETLEIKVSNKHNQYDNFNRIDDYASIKVDIEAAPKGDLHFKNAYLIDVKKSTATKLHYVDYPIQGVQYAVVYELEYIGDSMRGAEFKVEVNSTINTYKTNNIGNLNANAFKDYKNATNKTLPSATVKLEKATTTNPQKIYIQGGTFTATSSKIKVTGNVKLGDFKWNFNQNKTNDAIDREFSEPVNITLNKVSINPTTHPGGTYCGPFTINYTLDFLWQNLRTGKEQEVQTVKVDILYAKPNSNTYTLLKTETIRVYANVKNQPYNTLISNKCIPEGSTIKVVVNSNYNLHERTYTDNYKTYEWKAINNLADYCYQSSNKQTTINWVQAYAVLERKEGGHSNLVDILKSANSNISVTNRESYEITAVWMKSKLMKDKGYGKAHPEGKGSGWVNALNPASGEEVVIKAGYSFEFQIEVTYQTDAYKNEATHPQLTNLKSNQDIYNRLESLPLNDNLYLKTKDGKTISLTSAGIQFMKAKETGDKHKYVVTYELKNRLSPNGTNAMVKGLFIDDNTKDGKYGLDFYTAPVYGVPGKTTSDIISKNPAQYKPLCDKEQITFEVRGSYRDDLNVGIIH